MQDPKIDRKFKWPAEWKDSDAMSYFISDFTSSTVRPSRKLAFWSNLICDVCQYRKCPFVSHAELKRCLAWRGNPPRCIEGVLEDMQNKQTVLKCHKLTETWSQWGLGVLASPITSVWKKIIPDTSEQKFVVVSVLEECVSKVFDHIHMSNETLLFTVLEWEKLISGFVHHSNLNNFNEYLVFKRCITTHGDPVSVVKLKCKEEKCVSKITQIDLAIGAAKSTRDMLESRTNQLRVKINECHLAAKTARCHNRREALAHLRRKKMYEKSLGKQEGALSNTESLLLQLYEAEQHKIIISTLKAGADALNQNKVSLKEVDDIMDTLDEYKAYEEDITSAITLDTSSVSDSTLEEELEDLLAENSEPPAKKMFVQTDVIHLTKPTKDNHETPVLTPEELEELSLIEHNLNLCPEPPGTHAKHPETPGKPRGTPTERPGTPGKTPRTGKTSLEFEDSEYPVERESAPKEVTARLSPELRRKPGRKLVGTLAME